MGFSFFGVLGFKGDASRVKNAATYHAGPKQDLGPRHPDRVAADLRLLHLAGALLGSFGFWLSLKKTLLNKA